MILPATLVPWLLLLLHDAGGSAMPGLRCGFEELCAWKWNGSYPHGFRIVTAQDVLPTYASAPRTDSTGNPKGHFLLLHMIGPTTQEMHVWSPKYESTAEHCRLELTLHMSNMLLGSFKVVVEVNRNTSWVIQEIPGNNDNRWEKYSFKIGRISKEFNIILEVLPQNSFPSHLAIDNITLVDCFREIQHGNSCSESEFRCNSGECISNDAVCDINADCPDGEDELQECDKLPSYSWCTFEDGWCGWFNLNDKVMNWTRKKGPKGPTSPRVDHTYLNESGTYVHVDMSAGKMGAEAVLQSPVFHPPPCYHSNVHSPFYNSCRIRFHYHQYGPHRGGLELQVVEMHTHGTEKRRLFWSFSTGHEDWYRHVVTLPNITHKYYLQFNAVKGYSKQSEVAVDDISMSRECFGIGVPQNESESYIYNSTYCYPTDGGNEGEIHTDFINKTVYILGTCGKKGRNGPTPSDCSSAYIHSPTSVTVVGTGLQRWTVPEGGYYTIIAKGASGGQGGSSEGISRAAVVRTVVELHRGQYLYILVGQEGRNGCKTERGACILPKAQPSALREIHRHIDKGALPALASSSFHEVRNTSTDGGGGGGGGTFVYVVKKNESVPIAVAAGGGGVGDTSNTNDVQQYGHVQNNSRLGITGIEIGPNPAGAGGGWRANRSKEFRSVTGQALLEGGVGGKSCSNRPNSYGEGGYGGGGGGCTAGGGGGGFAGGNVWSDRRLSGEGGYSYAQTDELTDMKEGVHRGPGSVLIIPGLDKACDCDYRCVALNEYRSMVQCLCPSGWLLGHDNTSCIYPEEFPTLYIIVLAASAIVILVVVGAICISLYNRYQRKKTQVVRRRMLSGPDLQLNRLREASDSMMTEFNPNYEFGGGTYTIRDLKDIPRDHLRLLKALGQGAFGEVYQGFFRHRAGDAVEMPVAVKTLPALSTHQAETDFLMEALIMSKFNHPNIVHFIGVCFDKHPRFIVLELLAGGDLKTFLRESRPKPERPSPLTMKDLLMCAMDVAKGCRYMEENRFIHRDIAARNCLLTTKGPGRVVKIADFGMARDIYRADYYRKGGKAMLPIKWMPPEAFLDGIFTSKTDVWSFGVLLWEVMSLGYMPYTGCGNKEVMDLVTSGGRLEPPNNCPGPLYGIMTQCWHPKPDERPNFATIMERLGYCLQDPDVVNAPLPVFHRPPSAERDATIMRPPAHENSCLQVQRAADYLVPLPGPGSTHIQPPSGELPSSPSTSSVDKLLAANSATSCDWETSFALTESRSRQPLLEEEASSSSSSGSTDKPATVGSLVSLEKNSPNNNNNNNNQQRNSLKASLSLDASALAKQPLPYVNVSMTPSHIAVGTQEPALETTVEPQAGRPFTVQAAAGRNLLSENEISC